MANAIEAPASSTNAEGQTSHTPNQDTGRCVGALSDLQIAQLLRPVNPDRVGEDGKGFAHMEAWDIRRHLIRIFGFGGHDTDLLETTLIAETSIPDFQKIGKNGQPYGKVYEAWTIVYRVAVRLVVKVDGIELGHWHGIATGDATNQPSRADAHDLALKTADSQALKRAATNLGDQFGLSLYNKGSLAPVVQASLPYWKKPEEKQFEDDKVEAEPEVAAARAVAAEAVDAAPQGQEPPPAAPSEPARPAPSVDPLDALVARYQTREAWNDPVALLRIQVEGKEAEVSDRNVQKPPPDKGWTTFNDLLAGRIAELQGTNAERSAA